MGKEIDLLVNYPRARQGNVEDRGRNKTEEDRRIAREFGRAFFDGERRHGYGGFNYLPRFWQPVIPTLQQHFGLTSGSSLLDVGRAKGLVLHDLAQLIPGINVKGIDVSAYAIEHAIEHAIEYMKPHVQFADARRLPFADKSFDVVIAVNTVHNLERADRARALREIERVSRHAGGALVTVDAYCTEEEKTRMFAWNLTAKTIMSVDERVAFFHEVGYTGDYFWFIP